MTERMQLTVTYKNGNTMDQLIKCMKVEDATLCFILDTQVHGVFESAVKIPIANIDRYSLQMVHCDGWKVRKED